MLLSVRDLADAPRSAARAVDTDHAVEHACRHAARGRAVADRRLAPFGAFEFGLLAVAAVFLSTAYYLIVVSTRRGDLSLVAPFRYTALLFATIAGFVVWGDTPNALGWCGIALVVASGIYVLRASRRARAAPITPD